MNGYYALEFKGEKIGLKFALPAHRMFISKLQSSPYLVDDKGSTTEVGIAYLVYYGYLNNCIIKEQDAKYTFEDFMEWVEDLFFDPSRSGVLAEIAECYAASKMTSRTKDEPVEESKKKKKG